MSQSQETEGHKHIHNYIGLIIVALSLLLLLQGFALMVSSICCELKWKKDFTQKIRKFHRLVGFLTVVIALATVMIGIFAYAAKSSWTDLGRAGPLNMILALLTILIMEIFYRIWRKKETPWVLPNKTMNTKEFHEQVS
mmetsp:Transcript_50750/g.69649  ORF Transcript_50750/g.69649 Transcript_50750/m.69649 type:complete len:139 (-) Transcript_50750:441-857(-)